MASFFEVVGWLLKNGGKSAKENLAYYIENPSEAPKDIWEWINEKKLTCALLAGKNSGKSAKEILAYYIKNPSEAPKDIWEWINENKLTCALILAGILVIVIPLAIGFGPAGPILGSIAAGWQSGIGVVAAGSAFAVMQSLVMTGVFTGIGAGLISGGVLLGWLRRLGGLNGSSAVLRDLLAKVRI